MNIQDTESLMVLMRKHGVSYFKSTEVEIKIDSQVQSSVVPILGDIPTPSVNVPRGTSGPQTAAAAPPVDMDIPHHDNEVAKLLRLSDEDLVDRLFPEGAPPNG